MKVTSVIRVVLSRAAVLLLVLLSPCVSAYAQGLPTRHIAVNFDVPQGDEPATLPRGRRERKTRQRVDPDRQTE